MIHVARKGSKFLMVSTLTNPFSRGSVHITTAYWEIHLKLIQIWFSPRRSQIHGMGSFTLSWYLHHITIMQVPKEPKQARRAWLMAQAAKETVGAQFHLVEPCAMKPLDIWGARDSSYSQSKLGYVTARDHDKERHRGPTIRAINEVIFIQ
jgi:hypothetical protein